jgi:hypothetical protein
MLNAFHSLRAIKTFVSLPSRAKTAVLADWAGAVREDPGLDQVRDACIDWLKLAQDQSASADGGVARHYSLIDGWSASYPETTGYVIPTLLRIAADRSDDDLAMRARRMLDWLLGIQLPGGGFQGGMVNERPVVPVTFNTGQILLGLAAGVAHFGAPYHGAAVAAADWLRDSQDDDGGWRNHPTPFAAPGEKAYETHVAWGLMEADRVLPDRGYGAAALRNVDWALSYQQRNGWFAHCCLLDPRQPLTHTIGYALRGVIEAYRFSGQSRYLAAAQCTADALMAVARRDGALPGRLSRDWQGSVNWTCLTGNVQIAHCWLMLFTDTGEARYRAAGIAANQFVRRTVTTGVANPGIRGGVKGSFPVYGAYGRYQYLNWACKFLLDSLCLESELVAE